MNIPPSVIDSVWYNVTVACASEQPHPACTPGLPSPKRKNLPRHVCFWGAGDRVIKSVGFGVFQNLISDLGPQSSVSLPGENQTSGQYRGRSRAVLGEATGPMFGQEKRFVDSFYLSSAFFFSPNVSDLVSVELS